jgi:beta-lactamase class A
MHRLIVDRKIHWDALRAQGADLLLFSALIVVGLSYGLGYHLDWNEESGRPEDDVEMAAVPAPAAGAAASAAAAAPEALAPAPAPEAPPAPPVVMESAAPSMSAAPQPEMHPEAHDAAWDKMTSALDALSSRYPGRVSIFIRDLKTGKTWMHNPDDLFPAASLIKVPILIATFYKIRDGGVTLDDRLTITRLNRRGGSGSLKWRPDGTHLTLRDALTHMINESDNTATQMVLERVGIGYVQQQFPRMGLLYTGIYEEGMSIKGGRVAHENYTTAREMEMLLEKIYRGEAVDKTSSDVMMEILKKPKAVASRLQKGMPSGWEIAHKTGLLRQACHDSAIFFTPVGDYAITVLTGQNASYSQAKDFITKIAHVTFENYAGPRYVASAKKHRRRG